MLHTTADDAGDLRLTDPHQGSSLPVGTMPEWLKQ